MLAFSASAKPFRLFVAFVVSGAAVVNASLLLSLVVCSTEIPARYFGIVPLSIGLVQLFQLALRGGAQTETLAAPQAAEPAAPVMLTTIVMIAAFLSVSMDNLLIFSAVLARNGTSIAPCICAMLVGLYGLMGLLGAWCGSRLARMNLKIRALAPALTACVGLTTLLT